MYFNEVGAELTVQGPQSGSVAGIPLTVGLAGGGYVVIWQTADSAPPGGISARIYDASGNPKGDAFSIYTDTVNFVFPRNVDAIALPNGGFAIVTQHVDQLDPNAPNGAPLRSDIQLQYFSATGAATSGVIAVTPSGAAATGLTSEPALALANGKLMVTWDGGSTINGAVYDLSGNLVTPSFTVDTGVNASGSYDSRSAAVTGLNNGNFMEVWREGSTDAGNIRAAVYTSAGVLVGSSFVVNSATAGVQGIPHVSTLSNGNAIITWADYSTATVTIHGQLVSANGTPIGSEFIAANTMVSSTDQFGNITDTNLNDYGLTALNGGGFAVAYNNNKDTGTINVVEFNSAGISINGPVSVSNGAGFFPHINALAGGGFEVVWSNNQTQVVSAQTIGDTRTVFDPAGAPIIANFNAANGWTSQDATPRHVADLNGDGRTDVVGFGNNGVLVAYGQASGFTGVSLQLADFGRSTGWTSDNQYHRVVTDVNGDGKADILGFGTAGTYVSTINADNSFSTARLGVVDFGQNQGWTSQDARTRLVGDVNGDGKADIVGFGDNVTFTALGNGDGTFQPVKIAINNFSAAQGWTSDNIYHRELADVNGDGKLDIVGFGTAGTYVALSNGDGTFATAKLTLADFGANQGWTNQDGFSRMVADVNGDGKADIVGFTNGGVLIAFGNGDGTFQPVRADVADFGRAQGYTSDNLTHRELADVNHDGQIDIVGFGSAGVVVGLNHASTIF